MKLRVVACGVFEPELTALAPQCGNDVDLEFLEAGLHATPNLLRETIQQRIDEAAEADCDALCLGYGLCGRGTAGLVARSIPVVIPRVHDCLTLFLGSREEYRRQFQRHPGTYYLTPGWYQKKLAADGEHHRARWSLRAEDHPRYPELVEQFGEEAAAEIVRFQDSWKRNYTRVAVIDTGCAEVEPCLRLGEMIAEGLGWECERLRGDTGMLRDLLSGRWDEEHFLVLRPGQRAEASGDQRVLLAVSCGATEAAPAPSPRPATKPVTIEPEDDRRAGLGLGIDAGGTYTDAVIYDFARGCVRSKAKALTTHHDLLIGIGEALDSLEARLLPHVRLVALSTTFATNAIVEGRGGEPGCILMPPAGFEPSAIRWPHRAVVGGRMSIEGTELAPFDAEGCRQQVRRLIDEGVDSFAVSGYASVRNPAHELLAREVIGEVCDLPVVCGHDLSARLNFVNRANTAALNARLLPLIARLLDASERTLAARRIHAPLMVVKGDGSLINLATARARPIETILSGPAASVFGAQHLAQAQDAAVVDIGGTTTDAALVVKGRARLSEQGANVGGWQTSVEAVEVSTIGLGGDSALDFNADRDLKVGPRRVVPISYLGEMHPEAVLEALRLIPRDDWADRSSAAALDFFVAGPLAHQAGLGGISTSEAEVLDSIGEQPLSRRALALRLGLASPRLLNTRRMEDRGLVQRSALTPTDLLHFTEEFTAWNTEAARAGVEAFAHLYGCPTERLVALVLEQMTRLLCLSVLRNELDGQLPPDDHLGRCEVCRRLLDKILAADEAGPVVLSAAYQRPVVAIGAPAGAYMPAVSRRLNAEVIIPVHAEVANAVGAIVSQVHAAAQIAVRPSEFESFAVYAPGGRREFNSLGEAVAFASEEVGRIAREKALAAGASDPEVEVAVEERLGLLATGERQLVEVNVRATAAGYPWAETAEG